jgi:hypothetical protein|tara:strand:+ start:941 stop:1051 length:111 start_codon:yes stop_codon:yes gene_type:complete
MPVRDILLTLLVPYLSGFGVAIILFNTNKKRINETD